MSKKKNQDKKKKKTIQLKFSAKECKELQKLVDKQRTIIEQTNIDPLAKDELMKAFDHVQKSTLDYLAAAQAQLNHEKSLIGQLMISPKDQEKSKLYENTVQALYHDVKRNTAKIKSLTQKSLGAKIKKEPVSPKIATNLNHQNDEIFSIIKKLAQSTAPLTVDRLLNELNKLSSMNTQLKESNQKIQAITAKYVDLEKKLNLLLKSTMDKKPKSLKEINMAEIEAITSEMEQIKIELEAEIKSATQLQKDFFTYRKT